MYAGLLRGLTGDVPCLRAEMDARAAIVADAERFKASVRAVLFERAFADHTIASRLVSLCQRVDSVLFLTDGWLFGSP